MISGIFILSGSNIGDRMSNLLTAVQYLRDNGVGLRHSSRIYRSAAWGNEDQPEFFNQVMQLETDRDPDSLLNLLLSIEHHMGRRRVKKWGSRIIDLDILYYDQLILSGPALTVPHPGIPERRFTLVPLCEVAPDFIHPVLQCTQRQLLENCKDPLPVEVFK